MSSQMNVMNATLYLRDLHIFSSNVPNKMDGFKTSVKQSMTQFSFVKVRCHGQTFLTICICKGKCLGDYVNGDIISKLLPVNDESNDDDDECDASNYAP